jgi:hypothetical protein
MPLYDENWNLALKENKPGEWNLFVGTSVLVSDNEWWSRQAIDLPRKPWKEFVLGSSNPRQIFLVRTC